MSEQAANAAFEKGQKDYVRCGGVASNPLTEAFHPSYDPPDGYEDEYRAGWENARNQDN